jgi:hypothetical protein
LNRLGCDGNGASIDREALLIVKFFIGMLSTFDFLVASSNFFPVFFSGGIWAKKSLANYFSYSPWTPDCGGHF